MTSIVPSERQKRVYDFAENGTGNGVVSARAGSGKSHTLLEVARRIKSDDAIFLAFNTHVVAELNAKLKAAGSRVVAKTVNSLGNGAVLKVLGRVMDMQSNESKKKYDRLASAWVDQNGGQFAPDERKEIAASLTKLVNMARMTLTDANSHDALREMQLHFHIEVGYPSFLFPAVPIILQQGQTVAREKKIIDFTDQIWLPIVWNLPIPQYGFVLGDESQDWSRCQLAVVIKAIAPGGRFLGVGDRNQSIMAFSGADNRSFDNIKTALNAVELPLSICYRCAASHIRLAQMIVPEIEARPNAPEGEVLHIKPTDDLSKFVRGGDLVICRLTAPLISECIKLIKNRVSAKVRGRSIGYELTALLKQIGKLEGFSYANVVKHLEEYKQKRVEFLRQKDADESAIESLCDRVECLQVCAESYLNARSVDELAREIDKLFDDNRPSVWLSTIHRAKGLEADRVFILKPEKLPLRWKNQQAWELEQEMNLLYVALTRAKSALYFIGDLPEPCQKREEIQPELEAVEAAQDAQDATEDALEAQEQAVEPLVWNTCYSCGSPLQSALEQAEGVCNFCAGWTYSALPPEEAYIATSPVAVPAQTNEIDTAIALLDSLVHDKMAMYRQGEIREAVEELTRLWNEAKSKETSVSEEYASVDECCPICGKELLEDEEFLYCPEHGGPLSALVERQRKREEEEGWNSTHPY